MKNGFILFALFISTSVFAQDSTYLIVQETIETFFEGFHKGDTTLMKSVMMDEVKLQTIYKNKEGKDVLVSEDKSKLMHAIGSKPNDQKWDERLLDFSIQIDGNMANVWTPYEFWFNDSFSHCGVNSFQLFYDNGTWKIIYLIDTRRKAGCRD